MRFSICTLGCKSNQFESQAMAKLLTQRGHTQVPEGETSDAYLINTCSVTAVSNKKSRQTIRNIQKNHPQTVIGVCGCYAQLQPEEIASLGVDLVGGTGGHQEFIAELEEIYAGIQPQTACLPFDDPRSRVEMESLPSGGLEGRTRALLKIQDGCDHFCTYCIIPYARGKIRSLPWEEAREAIQDLMAQGYQEIVVTGIEISSWGKDLPGEDSLVDFLDKANQLAQQYQETEGRQVFFRLGSLEPRTITEEFCAQVAGMPFVRPHFHLSLQSGCDSVLGRMNRKYTTGEYLEGVSRLRKHLENPAITTDLIVGFPGETEEEFRQTLDFIRQCGFSGMHVFPYSIRPGTPAAKMERQIAKEEKTERSKQAREVALQMEATYQNQFIGKKVWVLFETAKDHRWQGNTPQHLTVTVETPEDLHNRTCLVELVELAEDGLVGRLVSPTLEE